ncbi:MAG: hypothetical protein ACM3UN_02675 [Bacillota bacterium]
MNIQENPTEPYFSCPYCLTKLELEQPRKEEEKAPIDNPEERPKNQVEDREKKKNKEKPSECQLHLGYLSERSSKEQIPEGCLVCKDIVECMLRKMRD